MPTPMVCPKCGARMREVHHDGITIEQCPSCRGVFLDQGELEHLAESERRFYDESTLGGSHDQGEDEDDPRREKNLKRRFFEELLGFIDIS